AASRNLRTAVLRPERTALLRSCAASFWRLRLIWDLMLATEAHLSVDAGTEVKVEGADRPIGRSPDTRGNDTSGARLRSNPSAALSQPRPGGLRGPAVVHAQVRRRRRHRALAGGEHESGDRGQPGVDVVGVDGGDPVA